jgi:hypothetical protein
MKYRKLAEFETSELVGVVPAKPAELRRRRLERFADLLEDHAGPVRLFAMLEGVPGRRRRAMRRDSSPFSIAFSDPVFRVEGLSGDSVGEASAFFGLSTWETHELVCDCHYFGPVSGRTIAERARYMAAHPSLVSSFRNFVAGIAMRVATA